VRYLLDTHVVDWSASNALRLSPAVRSLLADTQRGDLAILDVTLSELARHLAAGTIQTDLPAKEWLEQATQEMQVLPVTHAIALQAAFIKWEANGQIHRDPADLHIVAAAVEHRLPLITIDRQMHAIGAKIGLKIVW
jgi:PIN domain nuclease of toxin-antitoxin system